MARKPAEKKPAPKSAKPPRKKKTSKPPARSKAESEEVGTSLWTALEDWTNDQAKRRPGRPTDYSPELCATVIELGRKGKSKAQISAHLDVSRQTVDNWCAAHPEFLDAITRARELALAWWEDAGQLGMLMKGFNANAFQFQMKNRFRDDYRDVSTKEISGAGGGPVEIKETPRSVGDDHLSDIGERYAQKLRIVSGGKS